MAAYLISPDPRNALLWYKKIPHIRRIIENSIFDIPISIGVDDDSHIQNGKIPKSIHKDIFGIFLSWISANTIHALIIRNRRMMNNRK